MKKKIGIIGAGKHFEEKIYPILSKSKFFNIEGILRKKNKSFNKIKIFSENNFFKQKFEFVYISCPNKLHEKFIIKSLKAGYHVICEKPFITEKKNLNYILRLAKKKKKLLFECFMYAYHPVFFYLKKIIKTKKYGKINYILSNFRFPPLDKNNNRYKSKIGGGFFYDSASYLISLESYLFDNFPKNFRFKSKKIKKYVDLKGFIYWEQNNISRHYFWGEGQNYSNNIEIFFDDATIHIDKFFSKYNKEQIFLKIITKKLETIKFKPCNQFKLMFDKILFNYKKKDFQDKNYFLIKNQLLFLKKLEKHR